jgi:outer membrane protein OmpA-like peptidoglycan-associated protein
MHRMLKGGACTAALLSVVALVGCSEDLAPVTATWTQLQSTMVAKAADLRKQYNAITASVKTLPPVGASDVSGQTLTSKLGAGLSAHASLLAGLDSSITADGTAVQEAIKTGKAANVQKAIDDAKVAYDATLSRIAASGTAIGGLLGQLKAHNAKLAADAARVNTAGAKVDYTDIDFKKGKADFLFDRPNSQIALDKLFNFVSSCPELVVDLVGHTSDEGSAAVNMKLSTARAKAVQKWLVGKGVAPKKIRAATGVGDRDNVMAEPDAAAANTKSMNPGAVDEARRPNRRITLVVVAPCPAH